ncbi:hypothetical protein FQ015_04930 [Escherichia sp. HH26CH]|nr:hypothetical protein [Escherichia sp. HH26CH]
MHLKAQSAGRHRISADTDMYQRGHRLKQTGNTDYSYDAAGRQGKIIRSSLFVLNNSHFMFKN